MIRAHTDRVRPVWLIASALLVTLAYALLWSRWWYPLSDSSLYLSLGRSLAQGRGYTFMGQPDHLVPPLSPLMFASIMKLGGGIGAIQAVCIVLMLVAHLLCFLTLQRWVGQRLALAATLAAALSYWVFINAFTIMSEPLCLAMFWGGMYALSDVAHGNRRWLRVAAGCLLLFCASASRLATVLLVPGAVLWLWLSCRGVASIGQRVGWGVLFLIVFSAGFCWYQPDNPVMRGFARLTGQSTTAPATAGAPMQPGGLTEFTAANGDDGNGRYKKAKQLMPGVSRSAHGFLWDMPVLAGRWVLEGMAMPTTVVFPRPDTVKSERKNFVNAPYIRIPAGIVAIACLVLCVIGGIEMLLRRQWWVLGLLLYFGVFWVEWGTRVKPRYMAPIAPLLFLLLWSGWMRVCCWIKPTLTGAAPREKIGRWLDNRMGRFSLLLLLAGIFIGNAPSWAVEAMVRYQHHRPYYDVARRGAYAQLVDISAWLQTHSKPDETIYLTDNHQSTAADAHRRILYFLCGRKVASVKRDVPDESNLPLAGRLFHLPSDLLTSVHYMVVLDRDAAWPEWHLPFVHGRQGSWWKLYVRRGHFFYEVKCPPADAHYVSNIPSAGV